MIRHSFFDYNYEYLRFDTEWKFKWDIDNETEDTIHFFPFTRVADDKNGNMETWHFCGTDADHDAADLRNSWLRSGLHARGGL